MKTIIMYQCELCNEAYDTKEEALECESSGKETPIAKEGQKVEYEVRMGGGFDSYYVEMRVGKVTDMGHICHYEFEEYDKENGEWYESTYKPSGLYGNGNFIYNCKISN